MMGRGRDGLAGPGQARLPIKTHVRKVVGCNMERLLKPPVYSWSKDQLVLGAVITCECLNKSNSDWGLRYFPPRKQNWPAPSLSC